MTVLSVDAVFSVCPSLQVMMVDHENFSVGLEKRSCRRQSHIRDYSGILAGVTSAKTQSFCLNGLYAFECE
jgi:hypothetical protein